MQKRLRKAVDKKLRNSPAIRALNDRVGGIEASEQSASERAAAENADLRAVVDKQAKQLKRMSAAIEALQGHLRPIDRAATLRELDHTRLSSQVGAVEERLGGLEQREHDATMTADEGAVGQARSILDEVRREHEQIRVRLQIIAWYEERLRRVEESLAAVFDGDPRHPV